MGQKKIFVVFKTHFDIGFTHLAKEVIENYGAKMLPDVIKTCEDIKKSDVDKNFVWTMSSWPLKKLLDNTITSNENIIKAEKLISNGELTWHALPFTTHTEFCGLEEYIRGLNISTDLSQKYAYWPISAKMTDVPGHTYILPTILANAGIKFLHLGCNPGCMPPDVPRLFWWQGPDGSKVLTYYSKGAYGSDIVPPKDWPFDVWLAMLQTNDNVGPQDAQMIAAIENKVLDVYPDAQITFGRLDDFFNEIIKINLDIPVINKDLADSWIHGVGSYPNEVALLRKTRKEIVKAEKLITMLEVMGVKDDTIDTSSLLSDAYENALLFGEHTWGLDVKTYMGNFRHYSKKEFLKHKTSDIYKLMESSWTEQRERVNLAIKNTNEVMETASKSLGECVKIQGDSVIVFCHTGYSNDFWVDVDINGDKGIIDLRDGNNVNLRANGKKIQILVTNPPAMGYITYQIIDKQDINEGISTNNKNTYEKNSIVQEDENDTISISNEFYCVVVDKVSGRVISLFDKKQDKEWVDLSCNDGFLGYRYDKYGIENITQFTKDYAYRFYGWLIPDLGRLEYPEGEHETFYPRFQSVKSEIVGERATISIINNGNCKSVSEYGDTYQIITKISLFKNEDKIDIEFQLFGKEETSYVEAIHFVFPIKLENPKIRINKLGCIINPETDIVKDANNILYCIEDFVEINNGENSMSIISHDIPLMSIGSEGIYQFRPKYQESKPWIYFNAMNNSWGTNFPQWMGGDFKFKFTLFANKADDNKSVIKSKMLSESNNSISCKQTGGTASSSMELIKFDCDLRILSFKKAKYINNSYILRINEVTGKSRQFKTCIKDLNAIIRCDLQERPIMDVPCTANTFVDNIEGFGINTYIIRFDTNPY